MNTGAPTEESGLYRKLGFLEQDFRLFHLKDKSKKTYEFHYHDFFKIVVLLEGNVNYIVEGRSYSLRPYDIVLVHRGQIHRPEVDARSTYERMILYLSRDFLTHYREEGADLENLFLTAAYRHSNVLRLKEELIHPVLAQLRRLKQAQERREEEFAGSLYSRLMCLEFLIELNRAAKKNDARYLPTGVLDYRISGLITYINEHLTEDLSITALSVLSCTSPYHMMRLFKKETGYTIGSYIQEKRLLKANDLIAEGRKATEACFLSGFNNYSTFLRAYKNRFQCLPKRIHVPENP